MGLISTTVHNAQGALPTTSAAARLISKGASPAGTNKGRVSITLQVQQAQPGPVYVGNGPNKAQTEYIEILPTGDLLRDMFCPTDDIFAYSPTGAIITVMENFGN